MKHLGFITVLIIWVLRMEATAQLVADSQTNILDGVVTNVSGGITIGTNGAFTLLIVTNGAVVTNSSGSFTVGLNPSAQSNRVAVTGTGSSLNCPSGSIVTGQNGPANELDILKGGLVTSSGGTVGASSSSNLVLISDAGSVWQVASTISVGGSSAAGNNKVVLTNGGLIISATTQIGPNVGTNNAAWVIGPGSVWTNSGNFFVGGYAPSSLLVVSNGGKVFSGASSVGQGSFNTNSMAVITGAGSSWSSGYFYLGYDTAGMHQLIINNGGSFNTSSTFDIGVYANSNILTVADAGSSLQCQTYRIGYSSTANQCIVSNGATLVVLPSQPTTVEGTFTVATITGAGSVWTNAGDFDFGEASNVLAITSGGMLVNNNGYIQSDANKPNNVIVAGANSLWKNLGDLHLNCPGAQMSITNGGMVVNNYGYLGDTGASSKCSVLVSGNGSVWTNSYDLYVGNNCPSNQLTVANSGTVFARNLYLGGSSSSTTNNLAVNGGSLVITNSGNGTLYDLRGTLTLNSGTVNCSTLSVANGTAGQFIFNGGTLQINNSTVNNGSTLIVGDGTDTAALIMTTAGGSAGSHNFNNGLVITNNASLSGTGTVNGNVTIGNGGMLSVGTSNRFYTTINSGLVLSNGSTTAMRVVPGTGGSDSVQGLTNLVYGGTLQITNTEPDSAYAAGQSFKLFYSSHYSGSFANIIPASPRAGLRWDLNELAVDGVLRIFSTNRPPPVLANHVLIAGGNVILNAGAGTPFDPVYLLTSTNLASPITNWTCWSTNYFDPNGNASFTNLIVPGEAQRYFRLQLP